jgi:D-alanyl-lipoteichoic acid acyltransferase DltB (MBOAT superfamily)
LFYYKYANFALTVFGLPAGNLVQNVIIPAGISFYTFQKMSLLIDYYRSGKTPPPFLDYLIFCGFFPLTVAGPIERAHHLLPQMEKFRFAWTPAQIEDGVSWIVLGPVNTIDHRRAT